MGINYLHGTTFSPELGKVQACAFFVRKTEIFKYLFLECPYSRQVWNEVKDLTRGKGVWKRNSVKEALRVSREEKEVNEHAALPANTLWSIWGGRNLAIFEDQNIFLFKVSIGLDTHM